MGELEGEVNNKICSI